MRFYDKLKKKKEVPAPSVDDLEKQIEEKKNLIEKINIEKEQKAELEKIYKEVVDNPDIPNIENNKGLLSKIDELTERMDLIVDKADRKKDKQFRLPSKINRKLGKLAQQNKIMVLVLGTNRNANPIITPLKNGYIWVNGIPRNCSTDFIFLWKGKYPMIVIPDWDLNPIGTKDHYDAIKEGRPAYPVATIIRMLEEAKALSKKPFEMKNWIWVGLVAIAILYVLLG